MNTIRNMLLGVIFSLALTPLSADGASLDWEGKPLSLSPASIAKACAGDKGDEGDGVIVYFEKDSYVFDDKGAALYEYHVAYKITSQKGLEAWSTATVAFQPWRQDKPSIGARVVDAKGKASVLDQKTISDATSRRADIDLYTDSRILDAPLPNLAIGSIVEYRIRIQDKAPLLEAGSIHRYWFAHSSRIEKRVLTVECPASLSLMSRTIGDIKWNKSEKKPKGAKIKNGKYLRISAEGIKAIHEVEDGLPSGFSPVPRVEFTTGSSWAEVARAYSQAVAEALRAPLPAGYSLGKITDRKAAIAELLYRMQKEVRYTGINFGVNAIIPHSPADSIERGYGDCKDQASLLVTILEGNGIPARMALLCTGPGEDVPEDLPGFGLFDHAIVYLPEDRLWIDPTASLNPLGVLPAFDQGRLALVVDPSTTALVRIDESSSEDNRIVEEVEVLLPGFGKARIHERTVVSGYFEPNYRSYYRGSDEKGRRELLKRYVKGQYVAESLGDVTFSDPEDRSTPFVLELDAFEAGLGASDDSSALFGMRCTSMFDSLPESLTGKKEDFTREGPLELTAPYQVEYRFRVRASDGFRPAALPEAVSEKWGPCDFSADFEAMDDGSVLAILRFDTVKRVFEAEEVVALHESLLEFSSRNLYQVSFENVGGSLRSEGRYQEAMEEFRRLSSLYPEKALYRIQLADTLLQAGFTLDARKEAQEATRLEPQSSRAWACLAFINLHDPFGRMFMEGCDLPGALTAYAEAERLDPKDQQYPFNQAVIYEYGTDLERYGKGARLSDALKAYERSMAIEKSDGTMVNMAVDHFKLGDMAALKALAKGSLDNRSMQAWYLAAMAASDGTAAAKKEAARIISDAAARREILLNAGIQLMNGRFYAPAAVLIRDNAKGAKSQTQAIALANLLSGLKRFDASALKPEESVVDLCKLFLGLSCSSETADYDRLMSLFAKPVLERIKDSNDSSQGFGRMMDSLVDDIGMSREVAGDMAFGMITFTEAVEGSASAVCIDMPEIEDYEKLVLYAVKEDGVLRILAEEDSMEYLGGEMWRLLDAGDEAGAGDWYQLMAAQGKSYTAFPSMEDWTAIKYGVPAAGGGEKPDAGALRTVAALLLCLSDDDLDVQKAIDWLDPLIEQEKDKDRRLALAYAVMRAAYFSGKPESGLRAASSIMASEPEEGLLESAELYYVDYLAKLGRHEEAEAYIQKKLAEDPSSGQWHQKMASYLSDKRNYAGAVDEYLKTISAGKTDNLPYNNLVWYTLFMDAEPVGMPRSDIVVKRLMAGSAAEIQTLVCYLAKEGRMMEAREAFMKLLSVMRMEGVDDSVWVAFGMLAESFDLRETAEDAFKRSIELADDADTPGSCAELALIRMREMGLKP